MNYIQMTDEQKKRMLNDLGAGSMEDLLAGIPSDCRLEGELKLPTGMSELELRRHLETLAAKNRSTDKAVCFLGAGAYDHFIPAIVDAVASRGEFLTAYTPYQPEASQGTLQAIFEYQSMIAELTGMEVSNASLYEGASALAEAVHIAHSTTNRPKVVLSGAIHPEYIETVRTILANQSLEIVTVPPANGVTDPDALSETVDGTTCCVAVAWPNFFGCVERLDQFAPIAHKAGALLIVVADPISLGLLARPGDLDADIVVGEGQPLGIPLSLGGPYLGFMACRKKYMRRMPGRLVGQTTDAQGRRAFCLTLQTREQHIRRDRAASNICTNEGLCALRAAVYLAAMGPKGLAEVAHLCYDKAHYAASRIAELDGFEVPFGESFFKEFVIRTTRPVDKLLAGAREAGILAGVPLGHWFPELSDCFSVAVTEQRTVSEIDRWVETLATSPRR